MEQLPAPTISRVTLLQVLYYTALAAGAPFMTLYFKYRLVTPGGEPATYLIGLLFFIQSIVVIFSSPVAGFLGDLFHAHHRVLGVYSVLVAAGAFIMAVPGFPGVRTELPATFIILLIGIILIGLFNRPIIPLIDTETLHALHARRGNADDYGMIRQWGSLAWMVSSTGFGLLLLVTGDIALSLVGYGALYLLLGFIAWGAEHTRPHRIRLPLEHLRKDRMYRRFLIFGFLAAFPLSGSYTYTSYYMDDLHLNILFIGAALGVAALPEMPMFRFSPFIIRKLGSGWTIIAGSSILMLKLIGFYLLPPTAPPVLFMAIQFIHGFGWGLMYSGQIRFIDSLAHPDLRGTYQNLFQIPWTVSMALSGIATAWMVEVLGSRLMMGAHALILLGAMVYLTFFIVLKRKPVTSAEPELRAE